MDYRSIQSIFIAENNFIADLKKIAGDIFQGKKIVN